MYGEAKKLHLIEEILKIDNDTLLNEVESVISRGRHFLPARRSFKDFAGKMSSDEVEEIEKIIKEGCEQIHPDDWK